MKILFCNKYNTPFSGTEIYLFELMDTLRSRGHEVALFSMNDPRGSNLDPPGHLPRLVNFKDGRLGVAKRLRLAAHAIYSTETRSRLRNFVKEFRPDVAHVRNIYHHLSPSLFWELRKQEIPVLYHLNDFKLICPAYNLVCHGEACDRCGGGRFFHVVTTRCYHGGAGAACVLAAEAYLHRWLRTYQRCVTRFLAPSSFVRAKLAENGWDSSLIDVLPHPQAVPERANPAAPDGAPILYFGRLSAEKGLLDVLEAAARLPQFRFQIAGDGPQAGELQARATELHLRHVEFLGQVSRAMLPETIANARFTIFPSRACETFGKSILESYAQARPVIATDLGSRRELVVDGQTGFLYPPGRVDDLAHAIESLATQPYLIEAMGSAGYGIARTRHSPAAHYERLLDLYKRLSAVRKVSDRRFSPATSKREAKLRIAFIGGRGVGSKYSGIETWYEEVGRRLSAAGHDVTAYSRSYFSPPQSESEGVRILRLPTLRTKHLDTLVHTALSTIHAMFRPYDVVHYHALGPSLFSFLPRLTGKHTVVSVQGLDWQRKKWGPVASAVLRLGERAAVAFPDSTIVVSKTLQAYYHDRYGSPTSYIPNGTELRSRLGPEHLRGWNLEADRYVLFLGRFSPEKNCDLLIRAFQSIDTSFKLVLAGGSSYSDGYAQELRRHASERVIVLDWVSGAALQALLTHAALFVLPSDMEGLSLALLDAMSAGVCVLASDVPENRELVEGAGFTFRRGDEQDLARTLRMLIDNPALRDWAAANGRKRVRSGYLWPEIARQVEEHYRLVVGQRGRVVPLPRGMEKERAA